MLLSWLSKFIASLLVAVLSLTIITTVLGQTLLSSNYLETQLSATDSYARLSNAISGQVVKDSGIVDSALEPKVKSVITPDVVKSRVNSALDQLEAYYQGNGQAPQIDLSDIAAQLQAAGLPVNTNTSILTQPVTLGPNGPANTQRGHDYQRVKSVVLVISIVLVVLLVLLCWKRREYRPLANVLISVGISIGIIALFCHFVPGLADRFLKFNTSTNAFVGVSHDMVQAIAKDLAKHFGIIAIICIVLGIVARVVIKRITVQRLKTPPTTPVPRQRTAQPL